MGPRVAGVDMLEGQSGPQIMEVNSSPGLEGIEKCTQLDIADDGELQCPCRKDGHGARDAPWPPADH